MSSPCPWSNTSAHIYQGTLCPLGDIIIIILTYLLCNQWEQEPLSWQQGQPCRAGAGLCWPLLPGLFMGTTSEGGFVLSAGLERGAANIQEPWHALPALLLHWSPPWGKVGSKELQRWTGNWQLQLCGCPVLETFPPLSCLH